MVWEMLQQNANKLFNCAIFRELFLIFTTTLLSLLLPLSFLLLARLSCYNYLFATTCGGPNNLIHAEPCSSLSSLSSLFIFSNPAILYLIVSLVSGGSLVHGLTGKYIVLSELSPGSIHRPRLYASWILLCTLQVCVGLGIEGTVAAGIDGSGFKLERTLLSRVIFFLGLHETMLYWCRAVVKPVVDDTVFGAMREERWIQRAAMAVSLGTLWCWMLRDESEALVIVAEAKREAVVSVGVADLVGGWLYYLTVTIGMVRVVKGLMWVGMILLFTRIRRDPDDEPCWDEEEDKV